MNFSSYNFPKIEDYKNLEQYHPQSKFGKIINGAPSRLTKKPKISIVTACYNSANTLEKTIQSVLAQDYENIEYILIDGASKDNSLEIINKYKTQIDLCISEPDLGIPDAYNKGISLCTGEIIGLLNADDWYEPHALKRVMEHFEKYGDQIFYGKMCFYRLALKEKKISQGNHKKLKNKMSLDHPTTFIPLNFYKKGGLYSTQYRIAMDYDLLLRFYLLGFPYHYIDNVLTHMVDGGISDINWLEGYKECRKIRSFYGINFISNNYYFFEQVIRTKLSPLKRFVFSFFK